MPYDLGFCNICIIAPMHTGGMMSRRFLPLAGLILALSAGALQGQAPGADAPYNVKAEPLSDAQTQLLLQNKYQIREDGTVLAADGSQPMARGDMPYVIQRLESGQRLKALLQIDLILSRSEGEKSLTAEERESIRKIVRESWRLFSLKTRRSFRSYFSLQELERMDLVPLPKADLDEPELKDQEGIVGPASAASSAPAAVAVPVVVAPPVAATPAAAPPSAPAAVAVPTVVAPPALATPAASAPAPALAAPTVVAPPVAAVPAVLPPPAAAPAAATPAVAAPAPAAPAAVVAPVVAAPAAVTPPAASAPVAAAPAPAAPGSEPVLVEVTAAAFEKFLAEAPYGREAKALLRLISENTSFARNRVLNDVMAALPQILIDPDRAGERTYSRLISGSDGTFTIALNNGVVLMEKSKLFFGTTTTLLPRSAKTYAEAGLPAPALQALQGEAVPQKQESGPWGDTAVYADGSRRAALTPEAQAGALLAELVRLDSRLRAWDASPYATEVAARTAQWLFYDALASSRRSDAFLDPLTRRSYRQWLQEPAAYHDELLLSLSAGRNGTVDPRKVDLAAVSEFDRRALADCVRASAEESAYRDVSARQARTWDLAAYQASGLFSSESLSAARAAAAKALAEPALKNLCRPEWASEMAALSKSGVMLGEAVEAEKRSRQGRESRAEKD